ncbi:TRAP transporter small permease [Candidatus Fermentibacteria bacterium]|nr:TRAP transporter small permease [Candidatus Fermentibacteria bacterium]
MTPAASRRLARILAGAETAFLVFLVCLLLIVGLLQLVLRNVFHTGVLWFEPLSRYLVLWIAFAGAVAAAGEDRHIRVDLLPRLLKGRVGAMLGAVTSLAAAFVCAALAKSGIVFLASEREFGTVAFLAVPTWIALAAIPVGFALTGLRLTVSAVSKLVRALRS